MLIGARTGLLGADGGGSPSLPYDAEVEWLENDGSAWIDTGVSFAGDTLNNIDPVIISNFEMLTIASTSIQRCMYIGPSSVNGVGFCRASGSIRCCIKGTSTANAVPLASVDAFENLKIDFDTANGYAYRNDAVIGSLARSTSSTKIIQGVTMPIFAAKFANGGVLTMNYPVANCIRVKYFYVKNNKTGASFDGIPVRVGSVGYFYDRISGQLFGNAAEDGAFIVGPDKS